MRYEANLIVVKDIDKAVEFYSRVLGLDVICDFGANKTLTGGIALQTLETWLEFINKKQEQVMFGSNSAELYFEEDNMDSFVEKLENFSDIEYVHPLKEHSWGQRVIRFYDLDKHIIEVGENIKVVINRFIKSGMTVEQVSKRMDVPVEYVKHIVGNC